MILARSFLGQSWRAQKLLPTSIKKSNEEITLATRNQIKTWKNVMSMNWTALGATNEGVLMSVTATFIVPVRSLRHGARDEAVHLNSEMVNSAVRMSL